MTAAIIDDATAKAKVDALLEQFFPQGVEASAPSGEIAAVTGDYRPVPGWPGWFLRPMRARQELRAMELYGALTETATPTEYLRITIGIATCVTYRLELSDDPEEARRQVTEAVRANQTERLFRPITEDELLDAMSAGQIDELLLQPLGLGSAKETVEGNAPGPPA